MSIVMPQQQHPGDFHFTVTYQGTTDEMLVLFNTAKDLGLHADMEAATSGAASLTVRESGKPVGLSDFLDKAEKLHQEAAGAKLI